MSDTLTASAVAAILERLDRIEKALERPEQASPVLTRDEAAAYVKRNSRSAFGRWCKKWRVQACEQGRYARATLDRAIENSTRAIRIR